MKIVQLFKNLGPGPIIAAAFIGPGTVTVCTLAGINFGFALLWALGLSVVATLVLQELSGRIGLATGQDLSQLIRNDQRNKIFRLVSMVLVLFAIGLGNAAYESGNISGANLGLQVFWEAPIIAFAELEFHIGNLILGLMTLAILWAGNYKILERILISLVIFMSASFILAAFLTKPNWSDVFSGFVPIWNTKEISTIVALIGTTVVPYNLFLYASLAKKRWPDSSGIKWMRRDITIAIIFGGLVSMAILIVGTANTSLEINTALDVSKGLEGVFGFFAKYLMGFGLLAAGLTSSLTAPLAAGLVICGIMGWNQDIKSKAMRCSMAVIVGLGLVFASFGIKPVQLITLAQLANGILLPLISGWIIWIASQKNILGKYTNSPIYTIFASVIWLFTLLLGLKSIAGVLGLGL